MLVNVKALDVGSLQTSLAQAFELMRTEPEEGLVLAKAELKIHAAKQRQLSGASVEHGLARFQSTTTGQDIVLSDLLLHACITNHVTAALLLLIERAELRYMINVNHIGPAPGLGTSPSGLATGDVKFVSGDVSGTSGCNVRTQGCVSPLIAAARHGAVELVDRLLKSNADPCLAVDGWLPNKAARAATSGRLTQRVVDGHICTEMAGVESGLGQHAVRLGGGGIGDASPNGQLFYAVNPSAAELKERKRKCENLLDEATRHANLDAVARNALPT